MSRYGLSELARTVPLACKLSQRPNKADMSADELRYRVQNSEGYTSER